MSVRINFLPPDYRSAAKSREQIRLVRVVAGAALFLFAAAYGLLHLDSYRLQQRVTRLEAERTELKGQIEQTASAAAAAQELALAEREGELLWSRVLALLRDLTPQQVTWVSINLERGSRLGGEGRPGQELVTLVGTAQQLAEIAQLLGGIVEQPQVEQVMLKYAGENGLSLVTRFGARERVLPEIEVPLRAGQPLQFEMVITLQSREGGIIR